MYAIGIAAVIAWPVAYFVMSKWLQSFEYRISIGLGAFILSSVLALIVALLTVSYQTVKAATANPVDSLRYE
jgi:putative ABC transport system permease protein